MNCVREDNFAAAASLNQLRFDTSDTFTRQIQKRFNKNGDQLYHAMASPAFLMIEFNVTKNWKPFPISKLRQLKFQAPAARFTKKDPEGNKVWEFGLFDREFVLCAVIRTTPGLPEYVRIYHSDGTEVVPAQVGDWEKRLEFYDSNWSVKDVGRYMLIYFKVDRPRGIWPPSELDLYAPEAAGREKEKTI